MLVLSNDEVYIKTEALWLAFVVVARQRGEKGLGCQIIFNPIICFSNILIKKKKKILKLTFQFGQPVPDQDISSCTPHPYIVTVLSL